MSIIETAKNYTNPLIAATVLGTIAYYTIPVTMSCASATIYSRNFLQLGLVTGAITGGLALARAIGNRYLGEEFAKVSPQCRVHSREWRTIQNPETVQIKLQEEREAANEQRFKGENQKFILTSPVGTIHFSSSATSVNGRTIGEAHDKGSTRPTMEDQSLAVSGKVPIAGREKTYELYAIFDGHGGVGTATFLKENLERFIQQELVSLSDLSEASVWNALKMACVKCDAECKSKLKDGSGSTAIISLFIDGDLWIANVGDSRAIWRTESGDVEQLSEDAKPNDPKYKKSIEKRGGEVVLARSTYRINRVLAIARSFNDEYLKSQDEKVYSVSARPKIIKIPQDELEAKKGHLILCCDGVTDVASSSDIANRIGLFKPGTHPKILAKAVVGSSLGSKSKDNISAMVISL